jgi:hypothetical protein
MSDGPRLVTVGICNGSNVNADLSNVGSAVAVSITLTADYTMLQPPGFPFRPSFTGASTPQYPHTVAAGTSLLLLACETSALVDAGGATLNS